MKHRILLSAPDQPPVYLDLAKLVKTRLLIQAGSGGGKSYTIKRILEQTKGQIQHIIIDIEGEYAALRDHLDYVVAGKDADTPADPRGAGILAERLLSLKASAVLDLYELKHADRVEFVRAFLDAMVNAPKHLWHPVLVFIDEAHVFCPQQDRSESPSASAVIDLLTRGRKRQFCAILATQRLSKLHKDAAAECQNKLIGITALDIDRKRAADELGFQKDQKQTLSELEPGEFYAFGPALTRMVTRTKIGAVKAPPPSTRRFSAHVSPPTKKVRKLLPSLADIPQAAENRELNERELRRQLGESKKLIIDLERRLREVTPDAPKPKSVFDAGAQLRLARVLKRIESIKPSILIKALQTLDTRLLETKVAVNKASTERINAGLNSKIKLELVPVPDEVRKLVQGDNAPRKIVAAAKHYPHANASKIGTIAGVSARRSTFRYAIAQLRKLGVLGGDNNDVFLTPLGDTVAIDIPPLPKTSETWRNRLGKGAERDLFDTFIAHPDRELTPEFLSQETGLPMQRSTFRIALASLRHQGVIIRNDNRNMYQLHEDLR